MSFPPVATPHRPDLHPWHRRWRHYFPAPPAVVRCSSTLPWPRATAYVRCVGGAGLDHHPSKLTPCSSPASQTASTIFVFAPTHPAVIPPLPPWQEETLAEACHPSETSAHLSYRLQRPCGVWHAAWCASGDGTGYLGSLVVHRRCYGRSWNAPSSSLRLLAAGQRRNRPLVRPSVHPPQEQPGLAYQRSLSSRTQCASSPPASSAVSALGSASMASRQATQSAGHGCLAVIKELCRFWKAREPAHGCA